MLAEGEIAVFHQCKPIGPEEYRTVFASFLAVVASHAEDRVLWQSAFQIIHLVVEHFLHTQQVGAVVGNHAADIIFTVIPAVCTVRRNIQSDIESHHFHRLSVMCGGVVLAAAKEQNVTETQE